MKNVKRILFSFMALLLVSGGAFAQAYLEDERYGKTPEEREHNVKVLNFFRDAYEAKNYDLATAYLHELVANAPKASENIYIRGGNLYKIRINQAKSMADRALYVDSLMWMHDKRIEAFGDHPQRGRAVILGQKAADFRAFRAMDRDRVKELYNEAIEATEGKDADLLNTYFLVLTEDYQADLIETDVVLNEYERLSGLMATSNEPEEGQKVLDNLFVPIADCENLEKIYRPRYEADPNNVELMTKIVGMLGRAKCEGEFQLSVAENLYKVSPTPETGLALATIFEARGDYEKSLYYWEESINNEPDATKKADYMMRAAASSLAVSNYRQAASFANKILSISQDNGLAYMILGQAYGMSINSSCSDDFVRRAAYCLVVDNLQKARTLLSGDAAQVEALTKQINQYSTMFPSDEELFFRSLKSGDAYTVNCGWISGRTTLRASR